jgi:prepilin-type N-terminal cleavage/methylation domain-containing protein
MSRRGKSLLELLVVITVMSIVLGTISLTLTALFRIQRQLARDGEQLTSHSRLGKLWRADAHAALSAEVKDDCTFTLQDGRSVRYWVDGARLRREVSREDETEQREAFDLPAESQAAFAEVKIGERGLATLSIRSTRVARGFTPAVRPVSLSAVVNLHGVSAAMEDGP